MENRTRGAGGLLPLVVAAAILAAAAIALPSARADEGGETAAAAAMLRSMESADVGPVAEQVRLLEQARLTEEREQRRQELLSGESDLWSQFRGALFLGDSRIYGFSYYGFLSEEQVMADVGDTLMDMEASIPQILALRPSRIYVAYGINEFDMPERWPSGEAFAGEMGDILEKIEEGLSGVEIYVNSIMDVQPAGQYEGGRWEEFPSWNEALRAMCAERGFIFVDNAEIAAQHVDLYIADGVHFDPALYDYWGANMLLATYDRGKEAPPE